MILSDTQALLDFIDKDPAAASGPGSKVGVVGSSDLPLSKGWFRTAEDSPLTGAARQLRNS